MALPAINSLSQIQQNILSTPPYNEWRLTRATVYIHENHGVLKLLSNGDDRLTTCSNYVASGHGGITVRLVYVITKEAIKVAIAEAGTVAEVVEYAALPFFGGGIAGGVIVCATGSIAKNIYTIINSAEYETWIELRKYQKISDVADKFLKEDTFIRHYLCPISGRVTTDPVDAADDQIYELEAITKFIGDANYRFSLLNPDIALSIRDLRFNFGRANQLIHRLQILSGIPTLPRLITYDCTILRNTIYRSKGRALLKQQCELIQNFANGDLNQFEYEESLRKIRINSNEGLRIIPVIPRNVTELTDNPLSQLQTLHEILAHILPVAEVALLVEEYQEEIPNPNPRRALMDEWQTTAESKQSSCVIL